MSVRLDPVYPVVDGAAWVALLVRHGARLIQLRIKDQADEAVLPSIREALATCCAAGAQLVVNDYWRAAIEAGADFVHLGQEDLDTADIGAIRRAGIRLGVSTHDQAELDRALMLEPDYVALGPIYPTTLKVMRFGPQGLARIGEWKRQVGRRPLVAIGGITLERGPACLDAGADCVAMVNDIVGHPDPAGRIEAWIARTRRKAR